MNDFFTNVSAWVIQLRMYTTKTITVYVPVNLYEKAKRLHKEANKKSGLKLNFSEWMAVVIREGMEQVNTELSNIEKIGE